MFILNIEWGSVADWVSGIGTFAAVIVSLYLANHRKRPRIIFAPKIYDGNWYIIVYNPDYEPVFLNFTGDINTETKNKTIYLESLAKTETYQDIPIIFNEYQITFNKYQKYQTIANVKVKEVASKYNYYLTLVTEENMIYVFESHNRCFRGKRIYVNFYEKINNWIKEVSTCAYITRIFLGGDSVDYGSYFRPF